jgi:alginate O-acetyltransferase complex protein AlgJ
MFASKKITLMYLAVPMKARFYIDKLPASNPMSAGVKTRYARLMGWVADRKLMTVDLLKPITPVGSVAGQTFFWQTDQHWTEWSAEAAGEAVAQYIGAKIQLPAATGSGATLAPWITYRRQGDLTQLLPASQQAQYGLQTYITRQAWGDDMKAQNLLGNDIDVPDPAVRLIDGSLFRPNWGFPQKISNVLNRPVSMTWLRGDTGPWQTMLNFVESAQCKSNPPTLIAWGISEGEIMHGPMSPQWFFKTALMTPQQWLSRMAAAVKALP